MHYQILAKHAREWPTFSVEDCRKWFTEDGLRTIIFQLSTYVKQGHLIRLKRGLYLLNQEPLPHPFAIASRLDPQAIVSMETILNREGIIPDIPFATVSITPGRTARYPINRVGTFIFRHIKTPLTFGFRLESYPPYTARVAKPEKALLDLLWFHRFERNPQAYVEELRLDIPAKFSWKRFRQYAKLYNHDGLLRIAQAVIDHYQ